MCCTKLLELPTQLLEQIKIHFLNELSLYSLKEADGEERVEIIKAVCLQVRWQWGRQVSVRGWRRGSVWLAKDGSAFWTCAVQGHRAGGLGDGLRGQVVAWFCKEKVAMNVGSQPLVIIIPFFWTLNMTRQSCLKVCQCKNHESLSTRHRSKGRFKYVNY